MIEFLKAHRRAVLVALVVAAAGAVFVLVWFQPQKLFIETTVDEAAPGAPQTIDGGEADSPEPAEDPRTSVVAAGPFQSLEHETTGTAQIIELDNGKRFLRFEDLATSNGPDLRVYLSELPPSDDWRAYGERFVDLGALKGNRGNQNYEIPEDVGLSRYRSAVIWCRRFTVGFGVAGLSPG